MRSEQQQMTRHKEATQDAEMFSRLSSMQGDFGCFAYDPRNWARKEDDFGY
jgi:hypothetical protein